MRLSLAMIVKNESAHLGHCLASVKGLVDEMVVADTGSTDDTRAIALAHGARVIEVPWTEDFSAARNASLAACTGDWILVLDADEAIDPLDHPVLRAALEAPGAQAYRLWMRNYLRSGAFMSAEAGIQANDGRYAEGRAYSHLSLGRRLRLFRAQPGPVFQGRVHELPDPYFEARQVPILQLEAAIHHFGKVDFAQDMTKQAAYLQLAQADAALHPEDPQMHWNVLGEALVLEDWPVVLASAEAFLKVQDTAPALLYLGAARALVALGRPAEALTRLSAILDPKPDHAPALTVKGDALSALGRLDEAMAAYGAAMGADPAFTFSFLQAAKALLAGKQIDLARQVLEAGLDQNPRDLHLWEALVAHAAKHTPDRAPADAWDAIQAIPDGGQGIWHQLVAHTLLRQGDLPEARDVVTRGLAAFPGDADLQALADRLA